MNYYPLKLSPEGIDLIKSEEFFVDHAYQDSAGVWTIGYGSTMYKDGSKPKKGDTITLAQATDLLLWAVNSKANAISAAIRNPLNPNQADAVISLVYNIGVAGFVKSTVLNLINKNQNDPAIRDAFYMWNKITDPKTGAKKVLPGLMARRVREANLYFKPM